ncbi:MAG: hypothetical protein K0S55_1691 [Clostridia bacterium]|nr:hypothetical protein [Clostridia bacterium]
MDYKHLIKDWAIISRNEMPDIPKELEIHPDFLRELSKEEFEKTFRFLWDLFYGIFTDVSKDPQHFGVSSEDADKPMTGAEAFIVSNHVKMLDLLSGIGKLQDNSLIINAQDFKKHNKLKNVNIIFSILTEYGFNFDGLSNNKVTTKVEEFTVSYPENPSVIKVLYLVAKKTRGIMSMYYLFRQWSFRLLADGFDAYNYKSIYLNLYDILHKEKDRQFLEAFNSAMLSRGYKTENYPGRGPSHISYFKNSVKDPYLFGVWLVSGSDLIIALRIRNIEKCLPYLDECSERIKNVFRTSKKGCGNPNCNAMLRYVYEGKEVQRCAGCCGTAFELETDIEDIPHYIRLVELGYNK